MPSPGTTTTLPSPDSQTSCAAYATQTGSESIATNRTSGSRRAEGQLNCPLPHPRSRRPSRNGAEPAGAHACAQRPRQ